MPCACGSMSPLTGCGISRFALVLRTTISGKRTLPICPMMSERDASRLQGSDRIASKRGVSVLDRKGNTRDETTMEMVTAMRERGHCTQCNYPIERERWERPAPILLLPYRRTRWYKYYADGNEVNLCPGCQTVLPMYAHEGNETHKER
jgi:hypothetical protein